MAKNKETTAKVKVTLVRSTIGCLDKQKKTVQALGLKKIGSSVVREDNEVVRGMIFVVKHLVKVEKVEA